MANGLEKKKKKKSQGSITAGFIMVGVGFIFLLSNLNLIPDLDRMWPLFLIIVGGALLFGAFRERKEADNSTVVHPPTEQPPIAPLG